MDVTPSSHHGPCLCDLWTCQTGVLHSCVSDEFGKAYMCILSNAKALYSYQPCNGLIDDLES